MNARQETGRRSAYKIRANNGPPGVRISSASACFQVLEESACTGKERLIDRDGRHRELSRKEGRGRRPGLGAVVIFLSG